MHQRDYMGEFDPQFKGITSAIELIDSDSLILITLDICVIKTSETMVANITFSNKWRIPTDIVDASQNIMKA